MEKSKAFFVDITTCGGDGTVPGSCTWFQYTDKDGKKKNIIRDVGARRGTKEFEQLNGKFPFKPEDIDAVVITHGHDDHVGLAPVLTKLGYQGPFYATAPTISIMEKMLGDSAKIRQYKADIENARNLRKYKREKKEINKINNKRERGLGRKDIVKNKKRKRDQSKKIGKYEKVKPLFIEWDVYSVISQSHSLDVYKWRKIAEGCEVRAIPNDHMLGACSFEYRFSNGVETITLADSGDLGSGTSPILKQWRPRKNYEVDHVITETTNIGRPRADRKKAVECLRKLVLRLGKKFLITFSADKEQQGVYYLKKTEDELKVNCNVAVDAPLAMDITIGCYSNPAFKEWLNPEIRDLEDPFGVNRFKICASIESSKEIDKKNNRYKNETVVTTGGMAEGGRVVPHLATYLNEPSATFIFMGFQAPGTLGRSIIERQEFVMVDGKRVEVKGEIFYLPDFTAHACENGIEKYLNLYPNAKTYILRHGEHAKQLDYKERLKNKKNANIIVPVTGERYRMTKDEIIFIEKVDYVANKTTQDNEQQKIS